MKTIIKVFSIILHLDLCICYLLPNLGLGCENGWREFENSCYKMYFGKNKCGAEAENECIKNDAHLTSIHSAEENEFITTLYVPRARICIGGLRDGNSFRWMDGSDFNYQNWYTGEPNNLNGNIESCMMLYDGDFYGDGFSDGKWNDCPCDSIYIDSYVCKKSKLGKQL